MKAKLTTREIASHSAKDKKYKIWDTEIKGYFMLVLPSGVKSLLLHYRFEGKAKEYTIGKIGKYTAKTGREQAQRLVADLTKGIDIQAEKKRGAIQHKRAINAKLGVFIINEYRSHAEANISNYRETLRVLEKDFSFLHDKNMQSIIPFDIQRWSNKRLEGGLKASTINRSVTSLKSVLSLAVASGIIDRNPLAGMRRLKSDEADHVRFLEIDEEQRLRAALAARQDKQRSSRENHNKWLTIRNKPLLPNLNDQFTDHIMPLTLTALNTGMRRGELFKLNWPNVDFKRRIISVMSQTSKTRKTRHIPMNDESFITLITWRNQTEEQSLVFPSPITGNQLDNISTAWNALLLTAKIQNFRFHDLRHHFASSLVMKGVDLVTVKELLGHSKVDMTLRYAHLAPEHKAAAVALLNS